MILMKELLEEMKTPVPSEISDGLLTRSWSVLAGYSLWEATL